MPPSSQTPLISLRSPAKLNLHLGIHPGRDGRGYHAADSIMIGVALSDVVHIYEAHELTVTSSVDVEVAPEHNTAFVAARTLCQAYGRPEAYHIHLEKHIPAQSGMGGASSDAASVMLGLCRLWGVDPLAESVVQAARSVGADVPFFLTMAPAFLAGAGDVLVESFPTLPDVPVVLVRPDAGVSTVAAYREFDADPIVPESPEAMCRALRAGDASAVAEHLYNNLEPAANRIETVTTEVHEWLAAQPGVIACQMTGSGSCIFGLCENAQIAECIAKDAHKTRNWWSCATTTVGEGAQLC